MGNLCHLCQVICWNTLCDIGCIVEIIYNESTPRNLALKPLNSKYQTSSDCVRNLQLDAPLVMARLTDAKGAAGDSYAKLRKDVTLNVA